MNNTAKLTPRLIVMYAAVLIFLFAGWATKVLTAANTWGDVFTQKNMIALTLVFIGWCGAAALHYAATGDATPPLPAAQIAAQEHTAAVLTALSATMIRLEAKLDADAAKQPLQPLPPVVPAPPQQADPLPPEPLVGA